MTKRIIDADALDQLLFWLDKNFEYCKDIHGIEKKAVSLKFLLKKINEIATLVPATQGSIFDADGWCYDFDKFKNYYSENGFLIKNDTGYTTIKCDEQYRLCLRGVVAWRPLPPIPMREEL